MIENNSMYVHIEPNKHYYTNKEQILYFIDNLVEKINYPMSISRAEIIKDLNYIKIGLQNTKIGEMTNGN